MDRRKRLHVSDAMYNVVQYETAHAPIFSQPEDYGLFECLLADGLHRTAARVHAYCWMPQSIHLILQIDEVPVSRTMQTITSRYALTVHRRIGQSGKSFPQRYRAALIDPQGYSLKCCTIYMTFPVLGGLAASLGAAAAHSSHAAYSGQSASHWVTTQNLYASA